MRPEQVDASTGIWLVGLQTYQLLFLLLDPRVDQLLDAAVSAFRTGLSQPLNLSPDFRYLFP